VALGPFEVVFHLVDVEGPHVEDGTPQNGGREVLVVPRAKPLLMNLQRHLLRITKRSLLIRSNVLSIQDSGVVDLGPTDHYLGLIALIFHVALHHPTLVLFPSAHFFLF